MLRQRRLFLSELLHEIFLSPDAPCKQDKRLNPTTLTVLLPIFNEINTLPELLARIQNVAIDKEIIIVDDLSTDGTREFLKSDAVSKQSNVRVLFHEKNLGKGAALRTAIPFATGEFCIVQDGDLEYFPEDYLLILEAFQNGGAEVVYGSRFMGELPKMRPANRIVNWLLPAMVRTLYGFSLTDEATCYKAFKTKLLQSIPLTCERFEFCPEVTAKILKKGHRIVEVPIRYEARTMAAGKKIRWTDGVEAIWTLIKFRFKE